jgi:uncharacterized protein YdhG (YjbR/CyaY superfamily)
VGVSYDGLAKREKGSMEEKDDMDNEKVYAMSFAKVYPLLVAKAEKKGRTSAEVNEVTGWLTGYSTEEIESALNGSVTYGDFFRNAPLPNPDRKAIRGVVCGVRVETIEEPLMQEIRYLDKLIDELAKGRSMDKILNRQADKAVNKMWTCPKCGRTFKKTNQDHYCGEAPKTIEEYIERQTEQAKPYLRQVNSAIKSAIPDAAEKISWSMPTYWRQYNLIQFAAFKKHIGLYPGPEAVAAFADRLKEYKTSKGAIQLPYDKPMPLELIREIAKWCEETRRQKNE